LNLIKINYNYFNMPRKIKSYGRADLIGVALPNHASTYTVISHESVMDLSAQALQDAGFSITSENYRATHDGNIASAIYTLNFGDDPELSMMFAWSNSYNKQMRFKCGIGAIHKLNNTSLVCGDMGSWARKHTGSADTETKETIEAQIKLAKLYYTQLVSDKEAMKNINLDTRKQAQLLGMLFAEHDILTTEQASMIKQQMFRATYKSTHPGSLWEFYNFVTLALQQSHPKTWMEDQRVLHWFISDTFKFNKVDVDTTIEVLTEPVDPDQVDLEDMIADVEAENAADAEMQEIKTEEIIEEREEDDEYTEISYEEAEEHVANQIKEDENPIPEVTDAEAEELIRGQEAVDQQVALEHAATQPEEDLGDADFDLALASDDNDEDEDVESGDIDFGFA
tara:strand:- start:20529 stop:21716 length:1188 start_codon:yes stop_codon:yes gene_type:complete